MQSYESAIGLYSALAGIEEERAKKPSAFYHYTSLSGFIGMMNEYNAFDQKKRIVKLHASHIRFSNDTREFKIGEDEVNKYLSCINCERGCALKAEGSQVFAACFCDEEDLLHQWTCYGGDGGIAVKFDFSNILVSWWNDSNEVEPLNISPIGVYYDSNEFEKKVKEISNNKMYMTDEQRCSLLYAYMALRKDKAFEIELESRLILWPINDNKYKTEIKRKLLRNIIVPYIEVQLSPIDENKSIIESVIIGPSANQNVVFNAVFHTLEPKSEKRIFIDDNEMKNGIKTTNEISITCSKVPFRA